MLGLRTLLAAALVASSLLGLASADGTTTNSAGYTFRTSDGKAIQPASGDQKHAITACLLVGLTFSPDVKLTPAFDMLTYNYQMDCTGRKKGDAFSLTPTMYESSSSAEVTFNGVRINFRNPENTGISNYNPNLPKQTPNAYPAGSPLHTSNVMKWQSGVNTLTIGVGCNGMGTPYVCYYTNSFTCTINDGPPSATGDPQFIGLRGQSYQVHGVAGEIYNIVSDADLQYNSRFVFLTSGACPVVDGVKQKACWSHPGSFLGELGLKTRAGDKIRVVSGSAADGFESVTVNGKELPVGATLLLSGELGSVSRNSSHVTHVQVGNWDLAFENSDMFVNQRVHVLDARKLASHGLLGQTWRTATYPNAVKYIQGSVDDYVVRDKDIFGDEFLYNQFN